MISRVTVNQWKNLNYFAPKKKMLLFLLSFYLHYVLLNTEGLNSAKFNESLLVGNHRQNLHQVNALLKDLEQIIKLNPVPIPNNGTRRDEEFIFYDNVTDLLKSKILREGVKYQITNYPRTLPAEFLPSPQFDPFDPRLGFSHIFPDAHAPPPGIFQGPPYLNRPIVQNPELRPGPPYSGYLASSVQSLYPGLGYKVWTPRLRENGPGRYVAGFSESRTPVRSTTNIQQVPLKEQPLKSYIPHANPQEYFRSAISTPFFNRARSKSTRFTYPVKTPTMNDDAKIWLEQIAPYTRANKKLKKVSNRHHHRRKKTTVEVHVVQGGYTMSTGTANTADLFVEDEHGFLKVVTPKYVPQPQSVMTTKAGDVLYGKIHVEPPTTRSSKQRYIEMANSMDEGHLMVFIVEMCRLIGVKDSDQVREFIGHAEFKYNRLFQSGRIGWLGEPLQTVVSRLVTLPPGGLHAIHWIQTYAGMMFHMLLKRKEQLSAEVNTIIDLADLFYDDEAAHKLLNSLKDFEDYPNSTQSSQWITESLIDNFLRPLRPSRMRDKLVDSTNLALEKRFPLLLRIHHHTDEVNPKPGTKRRKRKKKYHHKKRQKLRQRAPNPIYMRQHNRENPRTRTTRDQPRIRAITTKRYRVKNRRLKTTFFLDQE